MRQERFGLDETELLEIARDLVSELEGLGKRQLNTSEQRERFWENGPFDSLSPLGAGQGIGVLGRGVKAEAELGSIGRRAALENPLGVSYAHALKAGQGLPYGGRRAALKRQGAADGSAERAEYGQGASFGIAVNGEYGLRAESEAVGDLGAVSAEGLSEDFRRDARRYDTGFEPY